MTAAAVAAPPGSRWEWAGRSVPPGAATGERGDRDRGGDHCGGDAACCCLTFRGAELARQGPEGPEQATDREPAGDGTPPLDQRFAQRGARGAMAEVVGGVEVFCLLVSPAEIARSTARHR